MSSAAESYHQYECPCFPFLHLNKTPRYVVLVFRLISQIGPVELWRIFNSKDSQYFKSIPIATRGVDVTSGIYSSTNYLPVYHLMSHTERLNDIEVFSNTMQSLALTHCMEHYSHFFKGQGHNAENFVDFVAGIILTHLQNIPYNSVSLDELRMTNPDLNNLKLSSVEETIRTSQSTQFGAGVYSTISLINHSCEPNVTRIYDSATGTSIMAIVALKALKAGEELQTSYSKSFTSEGLDIRREYLKSNYHFNCQCPACEQNWPLYLELCKRPKKFWCPNRKTANGNGNTSEMSIPLNCSGIVDTNGQCSNCGNVYEFENLMSELEKIEKEANEANQLVLQNKPIQGIDAIKSCLEYFDRNAVPPLAKTCITRDSLKKALDLIVYFQESM